MAKTLAFPVRFTPDGGFALVEQDTEAEILGSAHMALLCPEGHRPLLPDYGRPDVQFSRVQTDRAGLIRDHLLRDEPRLPDLASTEQLDMLISEATITVGGTNA